MSGQWRKAQKGELAFHRQDTWRPSELFMEDTRALFQYWGFNWQSFVDQTILDVGAGSRLRTKYFRGTTIIAIEPLAFEFSRDLRWSDLYEADEVYPVPAESLVENLATEEIDAAFCINVLDHSFNAPLIISNIWQYLKPGGLFILSVDTHAEPDELHPLSFSQRHIRVLLETLGFSVKITFGGIPGALSYRGSGEAYTIIAKKVADE